ncbi:MAG TPA: toxin-antitoxin system HicB family antitoxin [Mycobacteriales bacterium]|nr:toxin-antitoxin system HicB family antitoxin [Mycobacteriales bacterium]
MKINVRIPDDLHARIVVAAQHDRRSLNGEILWLIEQALTQR